MTPDTKNKLKIVAGLVLAFGIGAFCRWAGVPVPAPPALVGALLVLAMTIGYLLADRLLSHPAEQAPNCGGPTGSLPRTGDLA